MQFVGAAHIEATSGTLPTHQAGDLLIVAAVRWSSGTAPSRPAGWTSGYSSTTTYGRRIGSRVAPSAGTASGTWTNAQSLYVSVWRDATIGAVSSSVSTSDVAPIPALTQTGAPSYVATLGIPDTGQSPVPSGAASQWTDGSTRWSLTTAAVSSWPQQNITPHNVAASIELIPTVTLVGIEATTSWDIEAAAMITATTSWDIEQQMVGISATTSWDVEQSVGIEAHTSWDIESVRNWRDTITTPAYVAALADPHREVDAWAEIVTLGGDPVQVLDTNVDPIQPTFESASVEFRGEQMEAWALRSCTISDPRWVPTDHTHPLDPRANLAIRFWWRLLVDGRWVDVPVGTFRPYGVKVSDGGLVQVSFQGRDLLSVAAAGGYGGQVVDVGGLTVDKALARLFGVVAPALRFVAPSTTVTLPAVYQLGAERPSDDWQAIADVAGWIVRTDREGIVTAGPIPDPASVALSLEEGDDCEVTNLTRDISDTTYNRVVVTGNHADLTEPVWAVAEDDDPGSPTWVGLGVVRELRIESDVPKDNAGALSMARMHLGRWLRPTETVAVSLPAQPIHGYRAVCVLGRKQAGVGGTYRLSSWSLTLPIRGQEPQPMEVEMMARQS